MLIARRIDLYRIQFTHYFAVSSLVAVRASPASTVIIAFSAGSSAGVTTRPQVSYGRECAKVCGCGHRAPSA